jgi:hypothetical protein
LVEDFPTPLDLDNDPILTWSDGSPPGGQTAFRKEQLGFADGKLTITATTPPGCPIMSSNPGCIPAYQSYAEALSPNARASIGEMGVFSGELRSRYNNYRFGRYEVKASAPAANPSSQSGATSGDFLSSVFVFRSPRNPTWTEIDVELEPGHPNAIVTNLVNTTGAHGYPTEPLATPISGPDGYSITQEHVYAFNWTPTAVEWFLDGQSIYKLSSGAGRPIPTLSAKIMLNLWVFAGRSSGDPADNKYPFRATYDYLRFYRLDAETTYPCANPPGCLAAADKSPSAQNNPSELNYGR